MKKIKLTTWDRVHLLRCVPPTAPTIEAVAQHLRVANILELTEDEKELVGWVEVVIMTPTGPGRSSTWGDKTKGAQVEGDYEFEISFEDADFKHLRDLMVKYKSWPVSPLTLVLHSKIKKAGEDAA